jgi:hypothetical protein
MSIASTIFASDARLLVVLRPLASKPTSHDMPKRISIYRQGANSGARFLAVRRPSRAKTTWGGTRPRLTHDTTIYIIQARYMVKISLPLIEGRGYDLYSASALRDRNPDVSYLFRIQEDIWSHKKGHWERAIEIGPDLQGLMVADAQQRAI